MKRKVILYITSFALCTIISLYSIKSMDVTGKETDVQEDIYLAQVTEDKESIKSTKPLKKAQLLEDASVETSAMAMWEYNGGKTFVSWLFNNKEEKEIVAKNIYNVLKKYNGVWITCDVTPKKFIEKQNVCLPDFNKNLNQVTSRNDLQDRFNDIEHIKSFMMKIGFKNIEIQRFIEMKEQLKSFEILGVAREKYDELLENAIVAVIKI